MIGWVCGPMGRSMPPLTASLPARPTPTMRPSLIPMSALTHAEHRVERRAAPAMTASSSDGRRPALGRPRPERLGVAPDRLVAGRLAILADADPQVGVAEADLRRRRSGRSGPAVPRATAGSSVAHRARTRVTVAGLAGRPALGRAGVEVEVEAGRPRPGRTRAAR